MNQIAILIPIFNGLDYTKACLSSLSEKFAEIDEELAKFHIVVIDDGSRDGSAEWIHTNHPEVNVVTGTGDLWWSGAINEGVKYAIKRLHVDYILWWNNDILPADDYFNNLVHLLRDSKPSLILGSKIYLAQEEDTLWSMGGIFNPKTGEKYMIGRQSKDGERYSKPVQCDWLPGMGSLMPADTYEKVGLVDARNFPQYHGDSDFTYRAKLAGYTIEVHPNLIIYNDTRNSGLVHNESFKRLVQSLVSTKSNYNIRKDFLFYHKYATSIKAYKVLIDRYFVYIGGFFKWKILGWFGKNRNHQ